MPTPEAAPESKLHDSSHHSNDGCAEAFRAEIKEEAAKVGHLAKSMVDGTNEQYMQNKVTLLDELSKLPKPMLNAVLEEVNSKSHWYDNNPSAIAERNSDGDISAIQFVTWTSWPQQSKVNLVQPEVSATYTVKTSDE